MKYCPNAVECGEMRYFSNHELWCSQCREELTPCIRCLCGGSEVHPRYPLEAKACPRCGERFTEAYLGQCMAAQLREMVSEIAARKGVDEKTA